MHIRNFAISFLVVVSTLIFSIAFFKSNVLTAFVSIIGAQPTAPVDYSSIPIIGIVKDEKLLKQALKNTSVKTLMARLVEESNGGTIFDCHQEAHGIGRVGYTIYKEKAFGECDSSCHSGCYHGAMESFLSEKGTVNLSENINGVCNLFTTRFGKFECLHGVGHGLLAYVDYDMNGAVEECKNLGEWFSVVSCYGGMFMENILTAQGLGASTKVDHETEWANKEDPHFPCNALDKSDYDLIYQCYQMQTSWMLTLFGYNFERVKDECLKAPENMISVCFKSFGRDASGNSLRNPESIIKNCGLIPKIKDYYDQCIIGALNVIVDFWGPALKNQASDLCKITSEPAKSVCYTTLAARIPDLFKDNKEKEAICNSFEDKYKTNCLTKI